MMTALVVLRDHPLRPGEPGPSVAFAAPDVTDWATQKAAGNSVVAVREGERMSEFQLLEALLVPSGDNIADRLATWDAGSISAFVAKMNKTAAGWGLTSTRYADASGVDPGSSSTAADQAELAERLLASPVVRWIVKRHRIDLPVVGIVHNPNPALDIDGIVGVKGGYSSHAGTCLVTAAWRARHKTLLVEVVLGQPDAAHAATVDERLLEQATAEL
jgi:D-alanyl-D-alanine carboxypeptidase (penicillin-binding protein 5/6)